MDGQKPKPLWDGDSGTSDAPLRRPNLPFADNANSARSSIQQPNLADSRNISNDHDTVLQRSTLSVNAAEWYPAGYNNASLPNATGAQMRLSRLKQNGLEVQSSNQTNGICPNEELDEFDIYEKLQGLINILIEDPGQFDNLLDHFVETLEPAFTESIILHDVAKLIFSQAVAEPNFRYSAARLCRILDEQSPLFRTALHLFAKVQIEETPNTCDLALTVAELFAQSNCDNLYGNLVVQIITKLVTSNKAENIKCVCQVLKLTGASLDMHHNNQMTTILSHLQAAKTKYPSMANLINYVIGLRNSHWGQNDSNTSYAVSDDRCSNQLDGPIFYGPDGKELSEEEKQFLAENCVYLGEDFMDSDPDELFDPDNEMDEEVHAAFLEFTKGTRK